MAQQVFQVQAKDSVVLLNAFPTLNAVQNLNLDPTFNEEYMYELGNEDYAAQARQPETAGSFDVSSTGAAPSLLARMIYNYSTQAYLFNPATQGNAYTITETDFEYAIFDLINLKKPGETFSEATVVPNAQLTGFSLSVDAAGLATETYNFEGDLQLAFYKPYQDMISVPLTTAGATSATIPAAYTSQGINSGTYAIMYVFQNSNQFDSTVATWTASGTITISGAALTTTDPYDRVSALLYKRTPGTFPTIYYPTSARFMRGDRIDIWLVDSGVSTLNDNNRLLRCQSADISVELGRDKLQEIKRNENNNTTYWRALNYPLTITANVNILETTLALWADLQNKTLNESASPTTPDANNLLDLADFVTQKLVIKMYPTGSSSPLCTVTMPKIDITAFGERQQVQGRAERSLTFTGATITIEGAAG